MYASIEVEVSQLIQRLRSVNADAKKEARGAIKEAAGPLIAAIRGRAPQSDKVHKRYSTLKASRSLKAPNGKGRVVATYSPGNLKRSFKVLPLRRTKAVIVGPNLAKGSAVGAFKGNRTDAYYAHMVEFGAAGRPGKGFVRAAVESAGPASLRLANQVLKRAVDQIAQKNGFR